MQDRILGLHHITAIAGEAKRNYHFYTATLGLRLVKKTVNFDDPTTYHLYYGDREGSPGTILTFFPWEGIGSGKRGPRQVTEIAFSVPEGSLEFWLKRFQTHNIIHNKLSEKFGEQYLTFIDPDGLKIEMTVAARPDYRLPWTADEIPAEHAIRGFHNITITANQFQPTADVLTDIFGYQLTESHVNRYRFASDAVENASLVDIVEVPAERTGHIAGGSVHHVAFRVKDEEVLMHFRQKIEAAGLSITEKIDRNYFYSLYFREPGGVLFELATDNPGFVIDETVERLGTALKLPRQYEKHREEISAQLPALD